jgi:hypothetical protein
MLNNIGLHYTISKGQLIAYISKSMATKRIGTGNGEKIYILDGVDLEGPTTSSGQILLFDLEMQSLITWYCPMNKWSNDYCKLLKGGCGNVLYTLK